MFPLAQSSTQAYDHVPTSDAEASSDSGLLLGEKRLQVPTERPWWKFVKIAGLICATVLGVLGIFALGYTSGYHEAAEFPSIATAGQASSTCTKPYFRREWRSLSTDEKKEYMDAFQCFIDSPSVLGLNGSLYNDFSWVHNLIAHSSESVVVLSRSWELTCRSAHTKAPFLTWHRKFIFVYEKHLRESCGYKGALP